MALLAHVGAAESTEGTRILSVLMNVDAVVRHYKAHFRPKAEHELASFREEQTLAAAVQRAAMAESSDGKRYSHQHRLKRPDLENASAALAAKLQDIERASNFARLLEVMEKVLGAQRGLGALYIYDTALRIGAHLGRLPQRVYLHAGTRAGAEALGLDVNDRRALDRGDLPLPLRELALHEVEDILCIYKAYFAGDVADVDSAEACWLDESDGD